MADVYDAITSDRVYHKGMLPAEAIKLLFSWRGKHFNNQLLQFFVNIMGIYPAGTLVLLDTNELAVTIEPSETEPLRPRVLIVTNASHSPIEPQSFELASYNDQTRKFYKSIVSAVDAKDFNISI